MVNTQNNPPFWGGVGIKKWSPFFSALEVPFLAPENGHFWHLKIGTFAKTSKFEFDQNKNPSTLTGVGDHVANHESSWSAWRRSGSWYFVILILNFSKYSLALIFTKAYHLESDVQSKHLKWNLREGNIEMGVRGNFLSWMVKEFLTQPLTGGQRTKLTRILAAVGCQNFWYKPNL